MTQQNSNNNQNSTDEDEIDLIALVKTVWRGRKKILKTMLICLVIGLFVAIFSEKEYTASTTFVAQTSDSKIGGNLGGLAAMAGINLGGMNSSSGISPDLYPQIISSIPFQKELMETPLTIEGQPDKITFKNFYTNIYNPSLFGYIKKYTIGFPGLILTVIKGKPKNNQQLNSNDKLLTISHEENKLIKKLSDQLVVEINDSDGFVTLSGKMPEDKASAELTLNARQLLQRYVIDFKIQKSKEQLEYIKERYLEVEIKFKEVQNKLAAYKDRNKFVSTALGNTTLETIQDEYSLVYSVYTELSKQYEAQLLQVTEDTPVFTVLKPVTIPLEKSKPRRVIVLIIWVLIGLVLGVCMVLGNHVLNEIKLKFE